MTALLIYAAIVIGWVVTGLILHLFFYVKMRGFNFKDPMDYLAFVIPMMMGPLIYQSLKQANKQNKDEQKIIAQILEIIEQEENKKSAK